MADVAGDSPPPSHELQTKGALKTRLLPWLPVLAAFDLAFLITAGTVSNVLADRAAAVVSVIWSAWLLSLLGSLIVIVVMASRASRLRVGPNGIHYSDGRLLATYRWQDLSAVTIAPRRHGPRNRPALCVRLAPSLGPDVAFAQQLSATPGRPPFHDPGTDWVVVCFLDRFTTPYAEIEPALSRFVEAPGTDPT